MRRRPEAPALASSALTTRAPAPFDFAGTAYSHGWAVLDPTRWDRTSCTLERTERLQAGRVVHLRIRGMGTADRPALRIRVAHEGGLSPSDRGRIRAAVRRMFRLDEDLEEFHALARRFGGRWSAAARGRGRLLRSPTVFEDAVKTLCTTNVQWGGTKAMVRGLVRALGETAPDGVGGGPAWAFPTPEAIAAAPADVLESARLGYRAPYVRELGERVAGGELDLEALDDPGVPLDALKETLLGIRGVGPYAAATLLMLLGRYEHLAMDSVFRSFVGQRYFVGTTPTDEQAGSIYDRWGRWKYLGYWLDLWEGTSEKI